MTSFYKIVHDGYVEGFGTNGCDDAAEITEAEYAALRAVFADRPRKDGYEYLLREDLTWEEVKVKPDPEEELTEPEVYEILFGGGAE